jgi:hypothetical protein
MVMDNSSTHSLVENNYNAVEFTLAALGEGRPTERVSVTRVGEKALYYLYSRSAFRSRAAEYPGAALLDLHNQPSNAAELQP